MTDFDPWAPEPDEYEITEQPTNPYEPPAIQLKEKKTVANSDGAVTLTFKAGQGFNDPWLVLRAESVDEANRILQESVTKGLDKALVQFARNLHNEYKPQGGYQPQGPAAPQQQPFQAPAQAPQSAPQSGAKQCAHGDMTFRQGVSQSSGKAYSGWFCPAPRGPEQCKPIFTR